MKKRVLIFVILLFCVNFVLAETLTIKGKVVDQITGQPIPDAKMFKGNNEEITVDSSGNFQFSVDDSSLGSYAFNAPCYSYGQFYLNKDYNDWENGVQTHFGLMLGKVEFDKKEEKIDITGKTTIDVGLVQMYPMVDLRVESDLPTEMVIRYKYKNLQGLNGGGQNGYNSEHYMSYALPVGYEVFVRLNDENFKWYKSSTIKIPDDAKCKVANLEFYGGQFNWEIKDKNVNIVPYEFEIKKGWNLVPLIELHGAITEDSQIKKEDITAEYFYIPFAKKYFQMYPLIDDDDVSKELLGSGIDSQWMQNNQKYLINIGAWLYSKKSGSLKVNNLPEFGGVYSYNKVGLMQGWNFKTISKSMLNKKSSDIMGSCDIQKIAFYDNVKKKWIRYEGTEALNYIINKEDLMKVVLIKVSSDCDLGSKKIVDTDVDYPFEIGSYKIKDSRSEDGCHELNINGENLGQVCIEYVSLTYKSASSFDGYDIRLYNIISGKENFMKYIISQMNLTNIGSSNVYSSKGNGYLWTSNSLSYQMIGVGKLKFDSDSKGGFHSVNDFSSGTDEVTQWFLNKYPSNI